MRTQDPLCQLLDCHTLQEFFDSFIIITTGDLLQNVIGRLNPQILHNSIISKLHQTFSIHVIHHSFSIVLNELLNLIAGERIELSGELIGVHWLSGALIDFVIIRALEAILVPSGASSQSVTQAPRRI